MNANDFLDYALGQLDGPARAAADQELAAAPAERERLERLNQALAQLLDDGEDYPPPPGLAHRTLVFVAEARRPTRRSIFDFVPSTVPFRPADVAVAAGILIAGLMTLLPAVHRSRVGMAQAGCTYNLQQLGRALWLYGGHHSHYPFGPEQHRDAHTGTFAALLNDEQLLPDLSVLDCPSNGVCQGDHRLPRFQELCNLQRTDPNRYRAMLCWDYAYNISYRHASGQVEPLEIRHSGVVPLLADTPDHHQHRWVRPGNSPNHGGAGQNVLFTDLHVGWFSGRRISPHDDDMFLNADHQMAPGVNSTDAVLCPSLAPFSGWAP
ncbi:MAG: hypothetical protein U0835_11720 [Isosphaeraceae bacterium]